MILPALTLLDHLTPGFLHADQYTEAIDLHQAVPVFLFNLP